MTLFPFRLVEGVGIEANRESGMGAKQNLKALEQRRLRAARLSRRGRRADYRRLLYP